MNHHRYNAQRLLATSTGLALATLGLLSASAKAATYNLDFNALYIDGVAQSGSSINAATHNSGDRNINDEWSNWGVNISGINYRGNGQYNSNDPAAQLRLYDTSTRNGQDKDLETGADYGTNAQGNALIIQKHIMRNSSNPNDDANGGEITFDFTEENGSAKLVNFQSFTLLDVELDEHNSSDGINVFGYDETGNKILDIDVDSLVSGFYDKYDGQYNSGNHSKTNKTHDGVLYNPNTEEEPSFTFNGVTIYQEGQQLGNNTVFRFEIDENNTNAQGLSRFDFQYADVSGAVSGLRWSDVTSPEEPNNDPQPIPEPSALAGLVMLGTLGFRKYRQRRMT